MFLPVFWLRASPRENIVFEDLNATDVHDVTIMRIEGKEGWARRNKLREGKGREEIQTSRNFCSQSLSCLVLILVKRYCRQTLR